MRTCSLLLASLLASLAASTVLIACSDDTSLPGGSPDAAPDPNAPDAMPMPKTCTGPAECDDGIDCTVDTCSDEGLCVNATDDAVCDNGDDCDGAEICSATAGCGGGTPPAPAQVCRGDVNAGIALGSYHTCALDVLGYVHCWGSGVYGQLGYGEFGVNAGRGDTADTVPVNLGTVATPNGEESPLVYPVQLALGTSHTCALLNSGDVVCWGYHNEGQLGYGLLGDANVDPDPAQPKLASPSLGAVDIGGKVVQISTRNAHTCALLDTGAVRCWGRGGDGQLGYSGLAANIGDDEAPSTLGDVNVGGTVTQVAAGGAHTCALLDTGAVRCWGSGSKGRLGYGNEEDIGDNEDPATAGDVPLGGTAVQISAGGQHTCAVLDTGAIRCWGDGEFGALGYGDALDVGDAVTPAQKGDVPLGGTAVQVAAGGQHTCALLDTGGIRCWGSGMRGAHGYGTTQTLGDGETPADYADAFGDVNVGGTAVSIATGAFHTCAVLDTGAVRCWGLAQQGQLGYGNENTIGDNESPSMAGDVMLGASLYAP
ncbi:RCC1 domain-containing protein [Haliangium sp.]|uniref:RCC1 domain-containing protein n=1 Tax=Haliangium sp. TaxID=2663208 RepID=UPI003D0A8A3D